MCNAAHSTTLFASPNFQVENYPEQSATELIRMNRDGPPRSVSNTVFKGLDAALFLTGLKDAISKLSDEEVEAQYLGKYGPLMERQFTH